MALSTPSAKISQPIKLTLELDFASSLIFSPSPIPISKILGVLILLNNIYFGSTRYFVYCSSLKKDFPFFLPKYLFFDSNI